MSAAGASLSAVASTAHANLNIPLKDLEAASNPPSNTTSISDVDIPSPQNAPFAMSSEARENAGPTNGNVLEVPDIDKLAFKRDPPVARGPIYTTQIE
jgi:hypothetical protein